MAQKPKCKKVPSPDKPLPSKQLRFVQEYLVDFKGAKAARLAGYSPRTAAQKAHELLKMPRIMELIAAGHKKILKRNELSQDRVCQEIARLAFFDPRKMYNDDGSLKAVHQMDDDTAAAISGFDVVEFGNEEKVIGRIKKIRMWDKNSALEKAGKHLAMFIDKTEVTGKDGTALIPQSAVPKDEAALIKSIIDEIARRELKP